MTKKTKTILWKLAAFLPFLALALLWGGPAFAQGQPVDWQLGFQPHASPMKEKMEWFHNILLLPLITVITIFVMGLLLYVILRFNAKANPNPSKTTHNTMLEVIWTLVPVLILVVIVIPSMKMLYYVDRTHEADMTLKVTGYQWYWGYEYPDHGNINFLANMVPEAELKEGQPRLLATDNAIILPVDTKSPRTA
jgi:cytochrome c oxidase subunit 2